MMSLHWNYLKKVILHALLIHLVYLQTILQFLDNVVNLQSMSDFPELYMMIAALFSSRNPRVVMSSNLGI